MMNIRRVVVGMVHSGMNMYMAMGFTNHSSFMHMLMVTIIMQVIMFMDYCFMNMQMFVVFSNQ